MISAHIEVKKYIFNFTVHSGNIHKVLTPHIVVGAYRSNTLLAEGMDKDSLTNGEYFFDLSTSYFYYYSASPIDDEVLLTYRLLFANAPFKYSWDNSPSGVIFEYENRLIFSSGFNTKIDASAIGSAIVGNGSFKLENSDGHFNDWTNYFFENQKVSIYSIEDNIVSLEYVGKIQSKDFAKDSLNFKIVNDISILKKDIESSTITPLGYSVINLSDANNGIYKTRIWGRVNGVNAQSISAEYERKDLAGTVTVTNLSNTVSGSGTSFLNYVSSGDTLIVNDNELEVSEVVSNTSLKLRDAADFTSTGIGTIVYSIKNPTFNRVWNLSKYPLRETKIFITRQLATTIFEMTGGVGDLLEDDIIEFTSSGNKYLRTIKSVYGNYIVTTQAMPVSFVSGDYVTRKSIQKISYLGKSIDVYDDKVTIDNGTNGLYFTLARNFELDFANKKTIDVNAVWTGSSGTNLLTRDAVSESFMEILAPRNYLLIAGAYYEIASVNTTDTYTNIRLATNLAGAVSQNGLTVAFTEILTSDSGLFCDCFGETEDYTKTGVWIKNGLQFIKQQLIEGGFQNNISSSFASKKYDQIIGLVAPISPAQKNMPKLSTLVNQVNLSIGGSLFVNIDFDFDYKVIDFFHDFTQNLPFIEDFDVISWDAKVERNDLYSYADVFYDKKQSTGPLAMRLENDFNIKLDSTNTVKLETCLYNSDEARIAGNRALILSSMLNTVISFKTDRRFDDLSILDLVEIKFRNMPRVITGIDNRYFVITEIKKDDYNISFVASDLGGMIHRRGVITKDDALAYASSNNYEKIKYGYITDEIGLVEDLSETKKFNLIY